jgi:molecular chaperone GrpE
MSEHDQETSSGEVEREELQGDEESGAASDENEEQSAEEKVESLQLQLVQMAADFENFKRAAARREAEARDRAVRRVFEDLLPVFDNFDRAVQAAQSAREVETMRVGLEFIAQQMLQTLSEQGVEAIPAKGQPFDPFRHEAIEEVADSGQAPGTVLEEASRGYVLNGQVLRPARVKVAG